MPDRCGGWHSCRGGQEREASFSLPKPLADSQMTGQIWKFMSTGGYWAILFISQGLCFSSSLQEEFFKGVLYCYRNRKMWKWKNSFVKVSLSRVLGWHLCLSEVSLSCCFVTHDEETYLEATRQFWFIVLFTCNFFFCSSTCSIPLWAILLQAAALVVQTQTFLAKFSFSLTLH